MTWQQTLGRMLGLEDVEAIEGIQTSFAAPWATGTGATWVWFGCFLLVALAIWYTRAGNDKVAPGCARC